MIIFKYLLSLNVEAIRSRIKVSLSLFLSLTHKHSHVKQRSTILTIKPLGQQYIDISVWFVGVASALRVHMGYIAGLVPGTKAASTYQVDAQGTRSHLRCGSGPIISITSEEDRRLSLGLRRKESSEPRVNFILPSRKFTNSLLLFTWLN